MAHADQGQTERHEPHAVHDAKRKSNAGEREREEKGKPVTQRQQRVHGKAGEGEQRESQECGTFDLELPQHDRHDAELREYDDERK